VSQRGSTYRQRNLLSDERFEALSVERLTRLLGARALRLAELQRDPDFVRYVPPAFRAHPERYLGLVGIVQRDGHWLWTGAMQRHTTLRRTSGLDQEQYQVMDRCAPTPMLHGFSSCRLDRCAPVPMVATKDHVGRRHTLNARRVYYVEAYGEGPVPTGFSGNRWFIRNVCGNERCVNPEHSEEVVPVQASVWDRARADLAARRASPAKRTPPPPPPARATLRAAYIANLGDVKACAREWGVTALRATRWLLDARLPDDDDVTRDLDAARAAVRRSRLTRRGSP
jgi:hypothetical protein